MQSNANQEQIIVIVVVYVESEEMEGGKTTRKH